jgi:hypothetical protein
MTLDLGLSKMHRITSPPSKRRRCEWLLTSPHSDCALSAQLPASVIRGV